MKAKKHIEFDRVFAYLTEGKTDILWFESEDVMRRVGVFMVDLARSDEFKFEWNIDKDIEGEIVLAVAKIYGTEGISVFIRHNEHDQKIQFKSENQMRRAGQCLIDLARIGGNEVEITDDINDK
jgi:hypothetical protein